MTAPLPADWRIAVLDGLSIESTPRRLAMLGAWAASKIMPAWAYNPTASHVPMPGSIIMTSTGVRQYHSYQSGITATIGGLKRPNASDVRAALYDQTSLRNFYDAVRETDWPWVATDDQYPVMVSYLADMQDGDKYHREPPLVTDGLHGGYGVFTTAEYVQAAKESAQHAIAQMHAGSQSIRQKLRKAQ